MLRVWAISLSLLVTASLQAGGLTNYWQKLVVGGATLAIIYSSGAELTADIDDWQRIRVGKVNTVRHRAASLYLVLDFGRAWRTMHVQYIGDDIDGTPLVIGSRKYIIGTVKDDNVILENAQASLVGANGLIAEGVEVQEVRNLLNPSGAEFSLTLLSVDGADLEDLQPMVVAETYPEINVELEMISYRSDLADNLLGFFNYPAMRRNCLAGNFFPDDLLAVTTCTVPSTPASLGSPLFIKDSGELIGFHYGIINGLTVEIEGQKHLVNRTIVAPPALREFTARGLTVEARGKATVAWSKLKQQ